MNGYKPVFVPVKYEDTHVTVWSYLVGRRLPIVLYMTYPTTALGFLPSTISTTMSEIFSDFLMNLGILKEVK